MSIEDPFELTHNVGRTVSREGVSAIRDEFRRAVRLIETAGFMTDHTISLLKNYNHMELYRHPKLFGPRPQGSSIKPSQSRPVEKKSGSIAQKPQIPPYADEKAASIPRMPGDTHSPTKASILDKRSDTFQGISVHQMRSIESNNPTVDCPIDKALSENEHRPLIPTQRLASQPKLPTTYEGQTERFPNPITPSSTLVFNTIDTRNEKLAENDVKMKMDLPSGSALMDSIVADTEAKRKAEASQRPKKHTKILKQPSGEQNNLMLSKASHHEAESPLKKHADDGKLIQNRKTEHDSVEGSPLNHWARNNRKRYQKHQNRKAPLKSEEPPAGDMVGPSASRKVPDLEQVKESNASGSGGSSKKIPAVEKAKQPIPIPRGAKRGFKKSKQAQEEKVIDAQSVRKAQNGVDMTPASGAAGTANIPDTHESGPYAK